MNFNGTRIQEIQHTLRPQISKKRSVWLIIGSALLFLSGCAPVQTDRDIPSALDTRGPVASTIANEWWIQFTLGTIVALVVFGILFYILNARIERNRLARDVDVIITPSGQGRTWIWWGGIIIPIIILAVLLGVSMYSHITLAAPPDTPTVSIEVIGHRWWWEVRYPEDDFVTANQLHIPTGQSVEIHLTSADVIHSFWVPQLTGKMDLVPGEINTIWIQADDTGVFRGICAEFCGMQHANMHFLVVAETPEAFEAWRQRESQPASEPQTELAQQGQEVFMSTTCVFCHSIRGTEATGELGPDLTHIASRLTIGAGILENNRGNLGGWIIDPQTHKPGNLMPPANLTGPQLQALLTYLETLE